MSSETLRSANLELAWSLWTELGVPGVVRRHEAFLIDPEPLVIWSAGVIAADPRLRDLVFRWCRQHGDRLSASRLKGLLVGMPTPAAHEFGRFAAALNSVSTVRWSGSADGMSPWPRPGDKGPLPLPLDRPALLRFRLRALAGVGTRADVLCELLAIGQGWVSASDLAGEGYTKRNVARALAELETAGIARSRAKGNSLRFQLAAPPLLGQLVHGQTGAMPRWTLIFRVLAELTCLVERVHGRTPAVRRVEAHKVREKIAGPCAELLLPPPPKTSGEPEAYDCVLQWATEQAIAIANGTSPALSRS